MIIGTEQNHKIEFQLPEYLYLCPEGWVKFIRANESKLTSDQDKNQKTLDKSLSAYKATFQKINYDGGTVTFNCKRHYTLFLLRYGTMDRDDC